MSRVIFLLWASILVSAQVPYKAHGKALLPNPKVTPGAVRTHDAKQICDARFHTGTVRNVSASMKKKVCAEYGVAKCDGHLEIDHLISLEIGGSNDIRNLWPQPYADPGAHIKDKLENRLKKLVCSDQMELNEAQVCIAKDWVACYQKVMAMDVKKGKAVH